MKNKMLVPVILLLVCSLLSTGFAFPESPVQAKPVQSCIPETAVSSFQSDTGIEISGMTIDPKTGQILSGDFFKHRAEKTDISSPVDAREGVVRIITMDDPANPTFFATGSGFGVGVVGMETSVFITNRHVVVDSTTDEIANHIYILLNDDAVKEVYTPFGEFLNQEMNSRFKLEINPNYLVECEVLYPTNQDPEFPDYAIIRAARKIEGRVALQLLSSSEIEDTSDVYAIGFPGSADKIYNLASNRKAMNYAADTKSAQIFKGEISRRGSLKSMGDTMALTHNAQIDHGNSGGPLVEENGKVVGINTYGFGSSETSSVGYYLSIYIDYAMDKLKDLGIPVNLSSKEAGSKELRALEGWDPNSRPVSGSNKRPAPPEGKMTVSLETMEVNYTEKGDLDNIDLHSFNRYGEWIALEKLDAEGNPDHKTEFTLDERGERTKTQTYYKDGSSVYEETEYDAMGNKLKWTSFDKKGEKSAWCEYSYDEQGKPVKQVFYFSSGNVEYTDYQNGEMKKSVEYDGNNNLIKEKEYNADGKMVSEVEYDKDGNVSLQMEDVYDESGNLTSHTYRKGDYFSGKIYTYNENGDVLTEAEVDLDGNITEYQQYTYGNQEYSIAKFNSEGALISVTVHYEDDFGNATIEYDPDQNVLSNKEWHYEYDKDGFLTGQSYFRDSILRSQSFYEVTDVDINPLEPEDYHAGPRYKKQRTEE